jgi:hypothetical protein
VGRRTTCCNSRTQKQKRRSINGLDDSTQVLTPAV